MKTVLVAIVTVAFSTPLAAQWLQHQTPGIPRTPDGKANLTAPAPRTPDGKPDLSGVWMTNQQSDAAGRPPQVRGGYAGAGFKEGLPFQPWAADLQKRRAAEDFHIPRQRPAEGARGG